MARPQDFEQKAREAEALSTASRHSTFKIAFQKLAQDYRALAKKQRELDTPRSNS
jgi:hypothetical protein